MIQLPEPFANTPGLTRHELSRYDDRGPAWAWSALEHRRARRDALRRADPLDHGQRRRGRRQRPAGAAGRPRGDDRQVGRGRGRPRLLLTVDDVRAFEAEHGPLPAGGWLLLRTGWDARATTRTSSSTRAAGCRDARRGRGVRELARPGDADRRLRRRDGRHRRGRRAAASTRRSRPTASSSARASTASRSSRTWRGCRRRAPARRRAAEARRRHGQPGARAGAGRGVARRGDGRHRPGQPRPARRVRGRAPRACRGRLGRSRPPRRGARARRPRPRAGDAARVRHRPARPTLDHLIAERTTGRLEPASAPRSSSASTSSLSSTASPRTRRSPSPSSSPSRAAARTALVNAVLRRVQREARVELPTDDTPAGAAIRHSHPEWLVRLWWDLLGADEARALLAADNEPAEPALRVNTLVRLRPRGRAARPRAAATRSSSTAPFDALGHPGCAAGAFMPQSRAVAARRPRRSTRSRASASSTSAPRPAARPRTSRRSWATRARSSPSNATRAAPRRCGAPRARMHAAIVDVVVGDADAPRRPTARFDRVLARPALQRARHAALAPRPALARDPARDRAARRRAGRAPRRRRGRASRPGGALVYSLLHASRRPRSGSPRRAERRSRTHLRRTGTAPTASIIATPDGCIARRSTSGSRLPGLRRALAASVEPSRPLPLRVLPAPLRAAFGLPELRGARDDRAHVEHRHARRCNHCGGSMLVEV